MKPELTTSVTEKLKDIVQSIKKADVDAFNEKYEAIYGKLHNTKIAAIILAEISSFPQDLTVSLEQARTTSMQFNTKRNYVQLGRIELDYVQVILWSNLFEEYESSKSLSAAFFATMKLASNILKDKYTRLDNALNGLIRTAEEKDQIPVLPNSRFDK